MSRHKDKTTEKFQFPKQKQTKGRNIYGTITAPEEFSYTGTDEEMEKIVGFIKSTSASYEYCILGRELHESDKYHYHYFVKYKDVVRSSICDKMYKWFHDWSGAKADRIVFSTGDCTNVIKYCIKDGHYKVDQSSDCTADLEYIIENAKKKQENQSLSESKGILPRASVQKDLEITNYLVTFMKKNNYKVNFHTRQLYGVSEDDFYKGLKKEGFFALFGSHGIELCEKLVQDRHYYELPMWEPDIRYVKFKDTLYNMDTGLDEELNDSITPIIEYDFEKNKLGEHIKTFNQYCKIITTNKLDLEEFRQSLGRQFRNKYKRSNMMYLYGCPLTGKSTLAIPYFEVNKNIIGRWTNDSGYSVAPIAKFPRVIADEVNPFDPEFNKNEIKKLGEGTEFETKRKHNEPVKVVPKTGIFISNDSLPDITNNNVQALIDRFDLFEFVTRIKKPSDMFLDRVTAASPLVMVWATSRNIKPIKI